MRSTAKHELSACHTKILNEIKRIAQIEFRTFAAVWDCCHMSQRKPAQDIAIFASCAGFLNVYGC